MPRWTLNLSEDLARRVDERLAENCQKRSEVLRYLLERYLEEPAWSLGDVPNEAREPSRARPDPQQPQVSIRKSNPLKRPAPTRAQLAEAQRLAGELDLDIPDEALAYRSACADFIRKAKSGR